MGDGSVVRRRVAPSATLMDWSAIVDMNFTGRLFCKFDVYRDMSTMRRLQ